jgi:hypothetical protein
MRNYNTVLEDMKDLRVRLPSEQSERFGEEYVDLFEGIFMVFINMKIWFAFVPYFVYTDLNELEEFESEKI